MTFTDVRRLSGVACAMLLCATLSFQTRSLYAQDGTTPIDPTNPVPQLMKNLQSDSLKVAASAARSLGVIYSPGEKKVTQPVEPVIEALISKLESPLGAKLRKESAEALGHIQAKKAVEPLKEALNDEDVEVAIASANAVGEILPVDDARAYLIKRAAEDVESIKVGVYDAMAKISKPEDAEFLIKGLTYDNWRVQMNAVKGLERAVRAGARLQPENYDQIAAVFGNEITNAPNASIHFFTHINDEECLRAVIKAADMRGDGSKEDTSWRNRTYALRTIRHMGYPRNQTALPVVIRNLGDKIVNVLNESRSIIYGIRKDKYLSRDDMFALMLIELEKAEPLSMRAGIMKEMGNHIPEQHASRVAKVAAKTLDDAMEDKAEWAARARSITLLGAAGYTDPIVTIAKCVGDDIPNVRQSAGNALEQLAPLCTKDQRAEIPAILEPFLATPVDWRKTAIAARALGYYPSEKSIPALAKLLSHSVTNVRDGSSFALARYAHTNPEFIPTIQEPLFAQIKASSGSWEYGAKVLGAIKLKEGIPLLINILNSNNWRAQTNAGIAVSQIAMENEIDDQLLNEALIKAAQSEILQVQDAANRALRALSRKID